MSSPPFFIIEKKLIKALQKKYKFTEVPIYWHDRAGGKSKGANPFVIIKTLLGISSLWFLLRFKKK